MPGVADVFGRDAGPRSRGLAFSKRRRVMKHRGRDFGSLGACFGIAFGLAAVIASGCDRSAEVDGELRARQAQWTREIAAIRLQQTNIMAQLQSLQSPAVGNTPAFAAHARTKAIVLGAYQSVSDLDNVASQ